MTVRPIPPTLIFFLSISALVVAAATHVLAIWWHPAEAYAWGWIGSSILYLGAAALLLRHEISGPRLTIVLTLAVCVRLSFLAVEPIGSDDIYRYVWDGKVQAAGISPYAHAPNDPALAHLATDLLPERVNNPALKTVYFPVTQWLFRAVYEVAGGSLIGIRVVTSLAELGTLVCMWLLVGSLGVKRSNVLLYALCPLPIFQFSLDGHIDSVGILLLVAGLLMWNKHRHVLALCAFALSISVKPVAIVLLPLFLLEERHRRAKLLVFLIPSLILLAQFIPYVGLPGAMDGLAVFARHWTFNGALFSVAETLLQDNQRARLVSGMVLGALLLVLYATRRELSHRVVTAIAILLLCSPVVHPWYVAWLLAVLPAAPRMSGVLFVSLVSLTAFTFLTYQLDGIWLDYAVVRWAEYVPVVGAIAYETVRYEDTATFLRLFRRS